MTNWDLEAREHERLAAQARLEAGREMVADIDGLVKDVQRDELEDRLAKRERERESLENDRQLVNGFDQLLRKEQDLEDKARRSREQVKIDERKAQALERLKALRIKAAYKILTPNDTRELGMLDRMAARW